jgi:putative alpha-1,2-mannosidase
VSEVNGKLVKLNLVFDISKHKELLVKVGISAVDLDGALKNVDAEIPGWDFDNIVKSADNDRNEILKTFIVNDSNQSNKKMFLYCGLPCLCCSVYSKR